MGYKEPPEITEASASKGVQKARMRPDRQLVGAFLAGAYIAFGSLLAVTAAIFADVPGITWGDALHNWAFAGLGNLVGAAVFVAGGYWYLYAKDD